MGCISYWHGWSQFCSTHRQHSDIVQASLAASLWKTLGGVNVIVKVVLSQSWLYRLIEWVWPYLILLPIDVNVAVAVYFLVNVVVQRCSTTAQCPQWTWRCSTHWGGLASKWNYKRWLQEDDWKVKVVLRKVATEDLPDDDVCDCGLQVVFLVS